MQIEIYPAYCKGCKYCISLCKKKVLGISEETNNKGYHFPNVVAQDKCTGCRKCQYSCPDFAIYIQDESTVESNAQ
ncbi:MAG: 4Fe-4S dicluster domain-containing protein [Deltaproteobacteria bacterium]|nr:4Fe-4S dicluster domain-containing protein [Deltaproteobacteria bacterium]